MKEMILREPHFTVRELLKRNAEKIVRQLIKQVIVFRKKKWWTRSQRIRTAAEVPFEVALLDTELPPLYQRIALEAKHLQGLGLNFSRVAEHLGVDHKTVAKGIRWLETISP